MFQYVPCKSDKWLFLDMTLVAFICFLICLGIIVSMFPRGTDVFSPARVFGFVWCLAIGLADLKLSSLQRVWSLESWIQLLIGPVSFLLGTFILYILNLNIRLIPINKIRDGWRLQKIDHCKLYLSIMMLFIVFIVGYFVLIFSGKEIPLFSSHPGYARKNFQMFVVGLFIDNVVMIVFLSTMYFVTKTKEQSKKILLTIVSAISFLMYAITLQRLNLATAVILSFILVYYTTHKIRPSSVIMFLVIVMIGFFSISSLRSAATFRYFLYVSSQMRVSPSLAIITEPYMYIVMNLEMFVHSVKQIDQFTYGYYTFDFMTALTGLKHWMQEYFNFIESPYLYSGYNTYTAFWTYYRDFGILGTFSIGLLGGGGISALYYSMRKKPQFISLTAYCIAVYVMMFSIVNHQLGYLWIVYEFVIIYLVVYFVSKTLKPRDI